VAWVSVYICMLVPSRCRLCSCRQHNRYNNMSPHTHAHVLSLALRGARVTYISISHGSSGSSGSSRLERLLEVNLTMNSEPVIKHNHFSEVFSNSAE
jgi:hypothetical protein